MGIGSWWPLRRRSDEPCVTAEVGEGRDGLEWAEMASEDTWLRCQGSERRAVDEHELERTCSRGLGYRRRFQKYAAEGVSASKAAARFVGAPVLNGSSIGDHCAVPQPRNALNAPRL
jgi:hypothetical protein